MTAPTATPGSFTGRRGTVRHLRWRPTGEPVAVLLVLHGLGEHADRYAPLAEALTALGVEVWAPDLAGHGRSEGEPGLVTDVGELVDDAETMLRAIRGSRPRTPLVVAGQGLGAAVAALLVGEIRSGADPRAGRADDPAADVAGLVLAGSSPGAASSVTPGLALAAGATATGPASVDLVRDPERARLLREDPLGRSAALRPETLRALSGAAARTARLVSIGALDHLPVLLLHGEADDVAPVAAARAVAEALPRGRIVTFPDDRHAVLLEQDRDAVHAELGRFVLAVATAVAARA